MIALKVEEQGDKMRVLVIWEEIPEDTKFYVIENPTQEQLVMLKKANGQIINYEGPDDGALYLQRSFLLPEHLPEEEQRLDEVSQWISNQIAKEKLPESGPFDLVIWSGFGL